MTTHFPDLSHYPDADPNTPGTQTLDLHDVVALITKATEGTTYTDPTYATYRDRARAKGIPFAAYHWLHAYDVPGQARHAFSVVGPDVPLMIDDEDTGDGLSIARTLEFVREYRALGGRVVLEYLPHWFWQAHGSPSLQPLIDAGLALVSSNYTTYSDNGPGWAPYGGMTPAIWQYTSSLVLDGAAKVDMNAFKGSVDELRTLFNGGGAPHMTPATIAPGAPFPLPAGNYFGDINGPNASHGGYYASEQPTVAAIQVVVGTTPDGIFGPATIAAVKTWQSAHGLNPDGEVGPLTWAAMFPPAPAPAPDPTPAPAPEPTPDPTPAPVDMAALAQLVAPLLAPQVDEAVAAAVAKLRITTG